MDLSIPKKLNSSPSGDYTPSTRTITTPHQEHDVPANRHRCCASITYQCLYAPSVPREEIFQGIDLDIDAPLWGFYRHPGDEKELPTRPSHAIITACHQAKLFRIIDESLALYCGNRGQVSAEKMLSVYRRYREWIDDLPPVVSNVEVADQPLPHILYLQ